MTKWMIPCNPKYYKVDEAFSALKRLEWKQTTPNIKVGDIVYIYVSNPIRAIRYECKVNKVNIHTDDLKINDSKFVVDGDIFNTYPTHMELELLKTYTDELTAEIMAQLGVKGNIQGPRRVIAKLEEYIDTI